MHDVVVFLSRGVRQWRPFVTMQEILPAPQLEEFAQEEGQLFAKDSGAPVT